MQASTKRVLIIGLVFLMGCPVAGFVVTVAGMIGAFQSLGDQGISNPSVLAGHIGYALVATEIGFVGALMGFILMCAAAVAHYAGNNPGKSTK